MKSSARSSFREHSLSTGRTIYGGKNSESNDELVRCAGKRDTLLHTVATGSPFVNVGEDPTKEEISEACVFCAAKSQAWRDRKASVAVNVFKRRDMKKGWFSQEGSWHVKNAGTITVTKADLMEFEKKMEKKK